MFLIIELNRPKEDIKLEVGDILVFYNEDEYDYHQVIYDSRCNCYRVLSLIDYKIYEQWGSKADMVSDLNNPSKNNDFKLIEVLKPNEVVLRRVANE